jgi:hypothetical protein
MIGNTSTGNYYDQRSFLKNTEFKNFYLNSSNLPKVSKSVGNWILVPPECEHRIDLFSYQQYGSSRLWWIIAIANADIIKDPTWDFKSGMAVFVPRDSSIISNSPGNN